MSKSEKSLYSILGVAVDAPDAVIKAAFRALAKQYHPDGDGAGKPEATAKFIELQDAYKILSDPKSRKEYDDRTRPADSQSFSQSEQQEVHIDPDEIWKDVESRFPEINRIHAEFSLMSSALANRFMIAVTNGECGDDPVDYAIGLQETFLRKYFGRSKDVQWLAKKLLLKGRRELAQELNDAVKAGKLDKKEQREKFLSEFRKRHRIRPTATSDTRQKANAKAEKSDSKTDETEAQQNDTSAKTKGSGADKTSPGAPAGSVNLKTSGHGSSYMIASAIGIVACLIIGAAVLGIFGENSPPRDVLVSVQKSTIGGSIPSGNVEGPDNSVLGRKDLTEAYQPQVTGNIVPERDLSNDNTYPEITAEGLPYEDGKTIGLDAEIDAVGAKDNITEVAKQNSEASAIGETMPEGTARSNKEKVLVLDILEHPVDALRANGVEPNAAVEIVRELSKAVPLYDINSEQKAAFIIVFSLGASESEKAVSLPAAVILEFNAIPVARVDRDQAGRYSAKKLLERPARATLNVKGANLGVRIALVIGNSKYRHIPWLENPDDDAALMAKSLRATGFEVTMVTDADQSAMRTAMLEFGRKLRAGADASLFYYSGHAVEVGGANYLLPVDSAIKHEQEVGFQSVNVNEFLQTMNTSPSKVKIVVLDACRDNPFATAFRSVSRGLASVVAPSGSYIAFSTGPGSVAEDGKGKNSPYTAALAREILEPGLTIEETFKRVRAEVIKASSEEQVPWDNSSLVGEFYFLPATTAPQELEKIDSTSSVGEVPVIAVPGEAAKTAPEPAPDATGENPALKKKQLYDRIVGEQELMGNQMVPTDEEPIQPAPVILVQPEGPPVVTTNPPAGAAPNPAPLPLPPPENDQQGSVTNGALHATVGNGAAMGSQAVLKSGKVDMVLQQVASAKTEAQVKIDPAYINPVDELHEGRKKVQLSLTPPNYKIEQSFKLKRSEKQKALVQRRVKLAEENCLARAIYFVARSKSELGQVAVAKTILDRVKSREYPNTICGVVYQGSGSDSSCEFSFACDGVPDDILNAAEWVTAKRIAQGAIAGYNVANTGPVAVAPDKPTVLAPPGYGPIEASSGSGYDIQIGTFLTQSEAQKVRQRLRAQHGEITAGLQELVVPTTIDGGTRYSVRVGPMFSRERANQACSSLFAAGERDCVVRALGPDLEVR